MLEQTAVAGWEQQREIGDLLGVNISNIVREYVNPPAFLSACCPHSAFVEFPLHVLWDPNCGFLEVFDVVVAESETCLFVVGEIVCAYYIVRRQLSREKPDKRIDAYHS